MSQTGLRDPVSIVVRLSQPRAPHEALDHTSICCKQQRWRRSIEEDRSVGSPRGSDFQALEEQVSRSLRKSKGPSKGAKTPSCIAGHSDHLALQDTLVNTPDEGKSGQKQEEQRQGQRKQGVRVEFP